VQTDCNVGRRKDEVIRERSKVVRQIQNVQYRLAALDFWEDNVWKTSRRDDSRFSDRCSRFVQDFRLQGYNAV
jgi:hypothetical protein